MTKQDFFSRITFYSILTLILLIPLTKGGIEASIITGLISFALLLLSGRKFDFKKNPLFWPIIIYLVFLLMTLFWTINQALSMRGCLRAFKYAGLYVIAYYSVKSDLRFRSVAQMFFVAAFLVFLNGIYQWHTGWDFRHQYSLVNYNNAVRVSGSFNHPNNLAAYLTSIIFICYYYKDNKIWSVAQCLIIPLIFSILFLTKSRSPFLIMFGIFFFVLIASSYRKYTSIIFCSGVVGILVYSLFETGYLQHLLKALLIVINDRWRYWQTSLPIIQDHFFLGTGINTFMQAFAATANPDMYGNSRYMHAHSFLIQYWAEIGLVGLSIFLYLLIQFLRHAVQSWKTLQEPAKRTMFGFILASVMFLLHATVDNNMQSLQTNTLFWLVMGIVLGVKNETKRSHF